MSASASGTAAPKIQAFVRDAEDKSIIQQVLGDFPDALGKVVAGDVKSATAALAAEPSPDLLLVDLDGSEDPVAAIRELSDVCDSDVCVIVIGSINDIVLYRDLKRAGVTEYFVKPLVRGPLQRAFASVFQPAVEDESGRRGKLIAVTGVRGGMGATTLAAMTALHLATARKRATLALDLDLTGGDLALHFNAAPNNALIETFQDPDRFDRLFLERSVIRAQDRLHLLSSLGPINEKVTLNTESVLRLIDRLLERYRFVVADVSRHHPMVILELARRGTCVLVSDASLSCVRDIGRWRQLFQKEAVPNHPIHVLNHRTPQPPLALPDLVSAIKQRPDFVIPYDKDLSRASAMGMEAMSRCGAFSKGLQDFVQSFTGEQRQSRQPLLQRIFA